MLDFAEVKKRVTIEDAVRLLGLTVSREGKQLRSPCPACNSGGDRAIVITPEKSVWFCFPSQKGGDQLALISHVLKITVKESAHFAVQEDQPEKKTKGDGQTTSQPLSQKKGFDPQEYASKLLTTPEALAPFGATEEFCKAHMMGVALRGVHKGRLAFPCIDKDGNIVFASTSDFKLPEKY